MMADLNLSVAYRLTDVFALRAGYNAIWIGGVALAPNQWDFGASTDAGKNLDPTGSIFLNGLSVGLDAAW
jgi:long-subunit fatty acid transport protein